MGTPRFSYIMIDRFESLGSPEELHRAIRFVRDCGYDGIELNLTAPLARAFDRVEEWIRECGLTAPSFMTGEAYFDGLCLSSPDPDKRSRAVDRLISYLDVAKRFKSLLVVGMLQGTREDEPDPERALERITENLKIVAAEAESNGVTFVIEPVNHLQVGFNNSVPEVRALIRRVGSRALRPMVDTIHMNIEEGSMLQSIHDCGSDLGHVHLCESNGGRFGSGHIDFAGVLRTLQDIGYNGFASVKVYRHLGFEEGARSSLQFLKKVQANGHVA